MEPGHNKLLNLVRFTHWDAPQQAATRPLARRYVPDVREFDI